MLISVVSHPTDILRRIDEELKRRFEGASIEYNIVLYQERSKHCIENLANANIIEIPRERPLVRVIADLVTLLMSVSARCDILVLVADLRYVDGGLMASLLFLLAILSATSVFPKVNIYLYRNSELVLFENKDLKLLGLVVLGRDKELMRKLLRNFNDAQFLLSSGLAFIRENGGVEYRDVYYLAYILSYLAQERQNLNI